MWFAYRNHVSILSLGDITTAVAPIGLLLGRIANFINGELWGRATDPSLPWAMIFPNDPTQLPRHPSQLYEAGMRAIWSESDGLAPATRARMMRVSRSTSG